MVLSIVALVAVGSATAAGCATGAEPATGEATEALAPDCFTNAEWNAIEKLSPLPALPVDTTNKYADSSAAASLGHRLFFDKRIAGPIQQGTHAEGQLGAIGQTEKIACSDCHAP